MIQTMSFFRMIPEALLEDVINNSLIDKDLTLYFALCRKSYNGKSFQASTESLAKELKCHPNTVRSSLKRLCKLGHLSQKRNWSGFTTKLETVVKEGNTFVKGEQCK